MRISYRWLTQLLGKEIPLEELLQSLTMAGIEVEAVSDLGVGSGRLVVGRILTKEKHPNADKLSLCDVQAGPGEPYRIVCGAQNMKPGDLIPLALEGAQLPNDITIKKGKIRGEASQGMMCSGRELEFTEDHDGLLILPPKSETRSPYKEGKTFDAIIEIKVTPNRPDCLSIYGVARDLAAVLGVEGVFRPGSDRAPGYQSPAPTKSVALKVEAEDGCPRYLGRVIRGVKVGPSPLWLKRAVESAGLRSINNVVDVTNYILLEQGQPLHAFDFNKISGNEVVVRYAREGEKTVTLDGQEVDLLPTDLLIADGEKAIALAGVMGCANSEITEETTDVFLECAYFEPTRVRKTSKRLGKSTDSSYRFERGVDWSALQVITDYATDLILEVAGGTVEGSVEVVKGPEAPAPVKLSLERVNSLLGLRLTAQEVVKPLSALGFGVSTISSDDAENQAEFSVSIPGHRPDVSCDADLIEEVARVRGYADIPATLPRLSVPPAEPSETDTVTKLIQDELVKQGFLEAYNYSFEPANSNELCGWTDKPVLELRNPLSAEYSHMRSSLLPGLLRTVAYNHNRGNLDVRLFEVGKVYRPAAEGAVEEEWCFAAVLTGKALNEGWRNAGRVVDFFDGKAVAESLAKAAGGTDLVTVRPEGHPESGVFHPGKSAIIQSNGKSVMLVGALHPTVKSNFQLKRDAVIILGKLTGLLALVGNKKKIANIPTLPSLSRDLALVADKATPAADIEGIITRRAKSLLAGLQLFDVYEGERIAADKKSLAYSLKFNGGDRTLTDEEVNQLIEKILNDLKAKLGVELRN